MVESQDASTMSANQDQPLALPENASSSEVDAAGDVVRLDSLGPVVVNEDGTISRINNWHEMADVEKRILERVLLKRNRERLERLRAQQQESA
ncbi:hypothetical protein THASP1DRAFT_19390 [Thamnocephalis sphaerospora]|uniref:Uncharacterized protein n=1 Tax=Thamnocephalis sphaerospora TaxID=78915 RepID=A0A4P9XJ29_9FUNG|nr:hypothetical protein THASP1DRAFT_19390 [Thamnocephalis sphaerospora]|eukprot:RKP05753.1 hypothetical protein THASP1DRAFT_19390 [Thamnocephalis sphaerospora]